MKNRPTLFSAQICVAVVCGYAPMPHQAIANIAPLSQCDRPNFIR